MNYTKQDIKRGELTGFFGFAAAILFALLVTWVGGCEHGALIPIDPCGAVECPEPPVEPEPEEEWTITLTRSEYHDLLVRVCTYCQASVVCEDSDDSTDECDADVPPGHLAKHCPDVRGNK